MANDKVGKDCRREGVSIEKAMEFPYLSIRESFEVIQLD